LWSENSLGRDDVVVLDVFHIRGEDAWAHVGLIESEGYIAQVQSLDMAGEEAISRTSAEEFGDFRIFLVEFGIIGVDRVCDAPSVSDMDIAQPDILHRVSGHARDLDARQGVAVIGKDVADEDVTSRRYVGALLRSPVSAPSGDIDGVVVHMAHRDVVDDDILHFPLIHLLEGQSAAVEAVASRDGDVAVSPVALRTEFDASADPVDFLRNVGAIEHGTHFISRHDAVGDEDILADDWFFECVRALQHQSIVVGAVDFGVGDRGELAAVDVDAVAVGIDEHVVDRGKVASSDDDGEVSAPEDGDVAYEDVSAEFECDGLVAHTDTTTMHVASRLGILSCKSPAIDHAPSGDRDIRLSFSPDQRIMEIRMSAILVFRESEYLRGIVGTSLVGSDDFGTSLKMQFDMAFQPDATREVFASAERHPTATMSGAVFDCGIDGLAVEVLSIPFCAIVAHIV